MKYVHDIPPGPFALLNRIQLLALGRLVSVRLLGRIASNASLLFVVISISPEQFAIVSTVILFGRLAFIAGKQVAGSIVATGVKPSPTTLSILAIAIGLFSSTIGSVIASNQLDIFTGGFSTTIAAWSGFVVGFQQYLARSVGSGMRAQLPDEIVRPAFLAASIGSVSLAGAGSTTTFSAVIALSWLAAALSAAGQLRLASNLGRFEFAKQVSTKEFLSSGKMTLAGGAVLVASNRLDYFLVAILGSPQQLGIYAAALKYGELVGSSGSMLNFYIHPDARRLALATSDTCRNQLAAVLHQRWRAAYLLIVVPTVVISLLLPFIAAPAVSRLNFMTISSILVVAFALSSAFGPYNVVATIANRSNFVVKEMGKGAIGMLIAAGSLAIWISSLNILVAVLSASFQAFWNLRLRKRLVEAGVI